MFGVSMGFERFWMADGQGQEAIALLERLGRLLSIDAHSEQLLPVQWEALRYICKANQFSRTHAAVMSYLGLTKGTVSQTLKALESKGLIYKVIDKSDRRSSRIELTSRGEKILEQDPLADWIDQFKGMSATERNGLTKGLSAMLDQRLSAQGRAPFGQCLSCRYFRVKHHEGNPHYCDLLKTGLTSEGAVLICAEQRPHK